MPNAVLIHGGYHGGWCWSRVRPMLEEDGWSVETPTLTGVSDKAWLASPEVSLRTHVNDVVDLIREKDFTDVVLLGHSAAGLVVSGVAEVIPDRLRALVYLDGVIPESGESLLSIVGPMMSGALTRAANERGGGWLVPGDAIDVARDLGVDDPDDAAWVRSKLTGHPLRAFGDPLPSASGVDLVPQKVIVRCTKHANRAHLDRAIDLFGSRPGWRVELWPSGHDVMVTEPARIRELFSTLFAG